MEIRIFLPHVAFGWLCSSDDANAGFFSIIQKVNAANAKHSVKLQEHIQARRSMGSDYAWEASNGLVLSDCSVLGLDEDVMDASWSEGDWCRISF